MTPDYVQDPAALAALFAPLIEDGAILNKGAEIGFVVRLTTATAWHEVTEYEKRATMTALVLYDEVDYLNFEAQEQRAELQYAGLPVPESTMAWSKLRPVGAWPIGASGTETLVLVRFRLVDNPVPAFLAWSLIAAAIAATATYFVTTASVSATLDVTGIEPVGTALVALADAMVTPGETPLAGFAAAGQLAALAALAYVLTR